MTATAATSAHARPAVEARTAIVAIILISSLAFLLFQARKDVLVNLDLHEARLAVQLATAEAHPDAASGVRLIENGTRPPAGPSAGIAAWPGQRTVAFPLAAACADNFGCHGLLAARDTDTHGRFVILHGRLFASMLGERIAIQTSAPLSALTAGLPGRLAMDIAAVTFLALLLLLVRESRLSDYSVHRLLDASPIPLVLIDADGNLEFANRTALELLAQDRTTSLSGSKDQKDLRDPNDLKDLKKSLRRHERLFAWLIGPQDLTGSIETAEFEIEVRPQTVRHLLVSRQSLLIRSTRMIIASIADITVRHDAETALIKAKNAAEALERMKSESLAMISHELRTPVNGVLGLAQLLVQYELPAAAASTVRRLVQAGKTLAVIINDVVDLAMLEVRHIRLERRRFDPQEVVTGAASLASAAAAEKGLKVRVSNLTPLPSAVSGDPARLQQIIVNLVGNSIKFTQAGHIEVRTDLVARHEQSVEIAIEVSDTGIGIAPDVLPRLFQPFSQAETGHQKRFEGTGLGLAISKGFAEAMGGTISVQSEPGRGSTFTVRLPFERADDVEVSAAGSVAARVLVVDDVTLNREIVTDLLRAEGCEVRSVASGPQALETLRTERFDLILMDIRMPGMNGLDVTAAIRANHEAYRHTGPILGLTANPLPTERPLYLLRGIDGIIEKPVEVEKLRAALKQYTPPPSSTSTAYPALPERIERLRQTLGEQRSARIVQLFIEVADETVEAIATRCARSSLEDVADQAHRLSGAASNVGFERLAEAATELERLAQTGSALDVSEAALEVIACYREAVRCIHTYARSSAVGPENKYPVP
jgi:signal transduction histidine kinase/CheY-like chemotaxis protein/HPt (histidine-containing phosphotransfer) domain-containing protein